MEQKFKFRAFISYKHTPLDSAVAGKLQKTLEHYHIPREIQKKTGNEKVGRIFRDEEELAVASDLFGQLEQNIIESEYLICICSPRYKDAPWCIKEIETFLKYRDRDHILAVLIEGEPADAFPELLCGDQEPLAFDLRGDTTRTVLKNCSARLPRLVSTLIGCTYDDLKNRQKIYRMKQLTALSSVLAVAAIAVGATLFQKNTEITRNYQGKLENQSRYLAKTSSQLLESGDRDTAMLVAMAALPDDDNDRPFSPEAATSLSQALYLYEKSTNGVTKPTGFLQHDTEIRKECDYNENEILTIGRSGTAYVWDVEKMELLTTVIGDYLNGRLIGDNKVVLRGEEYADCYDITSGEKLWSFEMPQDDCQVLDVFGEKEMKWSFSEESNSMVCIPYLWKVDQNKETNALYIDPAHQVCKVNLDDGSVETWIPQAYFGHTVMDEYFGADVKFTSDGSEVALAIYSKEEKDENGNIPYKTNLYIYPVMNAEAVFEAEIENAYGAVQIAWVDADTIGVIVPNNTINAYAQNLDLYLQQFDYTLTVWDRKTGEIKWTYSDSSWAEEQRAECMRGTLADNTSIVRLTSGNTMVLLNETDGNVINRAEMESRIVGAVTYTNKAAMTYIYCADGSFMARAMNGTGIPNEQFTAYHKDLGVGNMTRVIQLNGAFFILAGDRMYRYEGISDEDYLVKGEYSTGYYKWSPDERRLAFLSNGDDGKMVRVIDGTTAEELLAVPCSDTVSNNTLRWISQDAIAVLADEDGQLTVKSPEKEEITDISEIAPSYQRNIADGGTENGLLVYTMALINKEYLEDEELCLAAFVKDGGIQKKLSEKDIFGGLDGYDSMQKFRLFGAGVSQDSKYALLLCGMQLEDYSEVYAVFSYDIGEDKLTQIPGIDKVRQSDSFFRCDGWISPAEDVFMFMEDENEITFVDASTASVVKKYYPEGLNGNEITFTPDGQTIMHQNGAMTLYVYDWKNEKNVQIMQESETGWADFDFFNNGDFVVLHEMITGSNTNCVVYEKQENGTYQQTEHYSVDIVSPTLVVGNPRESENAICFYKHLGWKEMIEKARGLLGDRELTEVERKTYLIE